VRVGYRVRSFAGFDDLPADALQLLVQFGVGRVRGLDCGVAFCELRFEGLELFGGLGL
jgi:hypothetical protein